MSTRGSAAGLRLCIAAARPQSCPKKFRPAARKPPPPFRGPLLKRPCVGAHCRGYCFGPLPRAPSGPGRAFPGPESCRKVRTPTLRIHHFRGSLFISLKQEASARLARCPVSSRFGGTRLWCRSRSPSRLHPSPPERCPGPLQSKHTSTPRPCSSPWPWKVFIAEAEPFADRCIEAFDA